MNRRILMGGLLTIAFGAALVVACGEDGDNAATTITPLPIPEAGPAIDSALPDAGGPTDAASEGGSGPAIVPQTTARIPNSINPYGLVYASDGFLYASGATIDAGDRKLAVWRFKDGALDTTFGTGGVVTVGIDGSESSFDIVEVSAGNFVVHAVTTGATGKVYLVKLTKDGGGTFTFGTPVVVRFDWTDADVDGGTWPGAAPPVYNNSWGIGLDKSNPASPKIVVFAFGAPPKVATGVQRTDNDRWIARVLADTLAPDPGFNGGKAFSADGDGKGLPDNSRRGIVLADGSIVSAGYNNFGAGLNNHVVLIRLKPDGTVDPAFGFGTTPPGAPGQTKFNPFVASGGFAEAYGVGRQSSGRYVTTGYGTSNFDSPSVGLDLVSFGLKADGLDATYGRLGSFAWQSEKDKSAGLGAGTVVDGGVVPHTERGRDMVVLPDDRIVHVGVYDDYATVFVLDKNGKPDPSSGINGVIEYSYPAGFFKVAVSPDGKQLATTAQSLNQNPDAGAPLGSVLATLKIGP